MPIMLPTLSVNLHEVNVLRRICNITIPSEVDWCPSGNKWRIISFMCVKLIIFLSFGRKIMVFLNAIICIITIRIPLRMLISLSILLCKFHLVYSHDWRSWSARAQRIGWENELLCCRTFTILYYFLEIHTFSGYCYSYPCAS